MNRIRAYTLMEVTIAMLLSAICITICYTAYSVVENYYREFQRKNELTDNILSLKHVIEKDFLISKYVMKTDSGMLIGKDSALIEYSFNKNYILRSFSNHHTDTFKLTALDPLFLFERKSVEQRDTIDQLELGIELTEDAAVKLRFDKRYSAQDLFR